MSTPLKALTIDVTDVEGGAPAPPTTAAHVPSPAIRKRKREEQKDESSDDECTNPGCHAKRGKALNGIQSKQCEAHLKKHRVAAVRAYKKRKNVVEDQAKSIVTLTTKVVELQRENKALREKLASLGQK